MGKGDRIFVILHGMFLYCRQNYYLVIYFTWNLNMAQGNVIVCQVDDGGLLIINPVGYIDCI